MQDEPRLLTTLELTIIIVVVLPIFFFAGGPIWEHAFALDGSILWSYVPIPVLVLLALMRRRVLSLPGFLVSTTMALSVKYMITASVALVLWSFGGPAPRTRSAEIASPSKSRPRPTSDLPRVMVELQAGAFTPALVVVRRNQPVIFRADDRSLHTVRGTTAGGSVLFHHPIVPGRESNEISFDRSRGRIELSCAVHEREHHGTLMVLDDS